MTVRIGKYEWEMESPYLTSLRDSNDLLGDVAAMRARMDEDGYILIRDFHDRDQVLKARGEIVQKLAEAGKIDTSYPLDEARLTEENRGMMFGGKNEGLSAFLDVVNSEKVMEFFANYLGGEVITYDYKWLRAVARGQATGSHYDIVYMGRGTPNLYTLWTPFGDTPQELGTLAVLLGSHRWTQVKETYGKMDVDRDMMEGWFSTDPLEMVEKFGGRWATTDFRAGDAIFFGMYTMHGSTVNVSDRMRISCDTRYQLASEPVDKRWVGDSPIAHVPQTKTKTIEEARREWGLS